ncbi:MAG TPA: acyl carrier protein [Gammaproteobacteria bacterium]
MPDPETLERHVLGTLAAAARADPSDIDRATVLSDLGLDSLTLVSMLAELEAALDLALTDDDTLEVLGARNAGELVAAVSRIAGRSPGTGKPR